ncbi:unnamed protein product [Effrenium voratum]|uniref:Uncharacterized protein n=1 Tax=Effrenium voratum TaxID=2562239 RepID=A0AA36HQF2_9DINO|nr:unnamed protein product [Effrenium voratum]
MAVTVMPAAAWDLVTLWSDVWDAPRFRGEDRVQKPVLTREALAPLLKLAASCVVALQENLKGTSQVPAHGAYGASRELLAAPASVGNRSLGPVTPAEACDLEDAEALRKASSWRDFERSDPLYALMGEVQEAKVVVEGHVAEETLRRYLDTLVVQGAASKPKDWVEVWAAMNIPVDSQTAVLSVIVAFCLQHPPPGGLGALLAELIKGHRVKTKAVEDAVAQAMRGKEDSEGVLRELLFTIFPKGPNSDWGWSRVGWSWQEWWKICARVLSSLKPLSAFDELGLLLERIELSSGEGPEKVTLAKQQMWAGPRLGKVRELLCQFGGCADADVRACVLATLSAD